MTSVESLYPSLGGQAYEDGDAERHIHSFFGDSFVCSRNEKT